VKEDARSAVPGKGLTEWSWPINAESYDRTPTLTSTERSELAVLVRNPCTTWRWRPARIQRLWRLVHPLSDIAVLTNAFPGARATLFKVVLYETGRREKTFWGWTPKQWSETLCESVPQFVARFGPGEWKVDHARPHLFALAYLFGFIRSFQGFKRQLYSVLAEKVFGRERVHDVFQQAATVLSGWGYQRDYIEGRFRARLCEALLYHRSPRLEDMTLVGLTALRDSFGSHDIRSPIHVLSRVLMALGIIDGTVPRGIIESNRQRKNGATDGIAPEWVQWVERWRNTSTLGSRSRGEIYYHLLKAGRWLTQLHPEAISPRLWTRDLAAQYVAEVCRMTVGRWVSSSREHRSLGKPLSAVARASQIDSVRRFFRDCQEWEWIPRKFDPGRCFAVPRSIKGLIAPNPRVIADDIWAKLLWSGLNLEESDLTGSAAARYQYPIQMVRALTLVWLFAGLRGNEICRLRVQCVRWHDPCANSSGTKAVCFLDVPVSKTNTAFTKPVDRALGEAVEEWERVRPAQPAVLDPKTGELVHFLFSYRTYRLSPCFLNRTLIPTLCRKAGVPRQDARGNITIHRARSTIASQLFNAKDPMSLFELQEWLGHRTPATTQHYAKISPTKLAKSFRDANYFSRNLRMIDVLIDQEAIKSGTARNEPWKFYDLGHGYCTYDFFEQCEHRMACAKCVFYRPKGSTQAQLLEGKSNLLRLRQEIPLRDVEVAAVNDGLAAFESLLAQLADVPTPAGPTPRELATTELVKLPTLTKV
jgi:integrase